MRKKQKNIMKILIFIEINGKILYTMLQFKGGCFYD